MDTKTTHRRQSQKEASKMNKYYAAHDRIPRRDEACSAVPLAHGIGCTPDEARADARKWSDDDALVVSEIAAECYERIMAGDVVLTLADVIS